MKKLLLFLSFTPLALLSQDIHFSFRLGAAGYHGDLTQHAINLSGAKPFFSAGLRYDVSEHFGARVYASYTALQADDKKGTPSMKARNLDFRTKLLEGELSGQYNFFSLNEKWWTPYVFAGIGFYHFNPYTQDKSGNNVFLQPLSTEGEGVVPGKEPYKRSQASLPLGFGAEYSLNEDMRLGLEFGYRKLFTDYIDDVSTTYADQNTLRQAKGQQAVEYAWRGDEISGAPYPAAGSIRGNPKNKDGYYYVALTYTVRYFFDKYKALAGLPSGKRDNKVGCPANRF